MKVLVTGASGFLGQHLVLALRQAMFDVRAAGRKPVNIAGVEWVYLDEVERFDWRSICWDVDAVVHLAGIAHARNSDEKAVNNVNTESTIALSKVMAPAQQFIFISSLRAICGTVSEVELTESSHPAPSCVYGRSKLFAEQGISGQHSNICVLRPVTVYGRGNKHNMARLAWLARSDLPLPLKGFRANRSYLSVQNFCSAVIFALQKKLTGTYHVADPDVACIAGLVCFFRDALGRPHQIFEAPRFGINVAASLPWFGNKLEVISNPLIARPALLLGAGWLPVHRSTRQGVECWAGDVDQE